MAFVAFAAFASFFFRVLSPSLKVAAEAAEVTAVSAREKMMNFILYQSRMNVVEKEVADKQMRKCLKY